MNPILAKLCQTFERTGDIEKDVRHFLELHGYPVIAEHCIRVGYECKRIAQKFYVDEESAAIAGFLHDSSAVFPNHKRIEVASALGLEILPEEESFPLIIHQKISRVMAQEIFDIHDHQILEAIGCHTTLKANFTTLDLVLFVADKIEWDQQGKPPYIIDLKEQLEVSLKHGAFAYIKYLWDQKDSLKVIHPWLSDAYYELRNTLDL